MIADPPQHQPQPSDCSGSAPDLSLVFQHPQGLLAARSITKTLIRQAKIAAIPATTPQTSSSASLSSSSQARPGMDSSNAGMLNSLFTFTDPPAQYSSSARQGGPRPIAPAPRAPNHETPGKSHPVLSPTTAPTHGHHTDSFSGVEDGNTSQPYSSYIPTTGRDMAAIRPRIPPASAPTAPNSLSSLQASESAATACHSSTNGVWVRHDFPKIMPQALQSSTRPPQPGFLTLQNSTFTSINGSQSMNPPPRKASSKKRKNPFEDEKKPKVRRKAKAETEESVFDDSIYMRILEFTPPAFLHKARLVCQAWRGYVDQFTSIYINQRKENFGQDMPPPPKHLTDQQYNELLGGKKGCLAEGCNDRKSIRTHWSWYKRWCWECWKERIEREDRVMKSRGIIYGRTTLTKMLECIPVGMHDSFLKPHDYMENNEATRARGAPRLYKYYLTEDINQIIDDFESLTPAPYVENPNHTAAERASALAAHQALMDGLEDKRVAFFAERKAKNDEHMAQVLKIEACIRDRRARNRNPYDVNRNARKELFSKRATEDLPHIDLEFVRNTVAYRAATRIFRDGGTERGWLTLKPKIVAEWDEAQEKRKEEGEVMGISDATDPRGPNGTKTGDDSFRLGGPDGGMRDDSSAYMRLQSYQSQLQKLEENKHLRPFATHGLPGLRHVDYGQGLPNHLSLFSSGASSSFAGLPYGSALTGAGDGSSSAAPLTRSQSAPLGHHLAPPAWFTQAVSGSNLSGIPHGSIHNPTTQITVNSLLGPSTPTPARTRTPPRP